MTRLEPYVRDPGSASDIGGNSESEAEVVVVSAKTKMKCLICATELSSELQPVAQDDLVTVKLLCQLFKILKLSTSICRFLVGTSLPIVVYCSSCEQVVSNCVKISEEIERLRNSLEKLTSKVKEGFIEGYYCRRDVDDSGDEKDKAGVHIRKTLVQCWITCSVPIDKLFENTPNVVIPFARNPAFEQNSDSETGDDTESRTTTPVYDDDYGSCLVGSRSPSPVLSDHESSNAVNIEIDPLVLKLGSERHAVDPTNKNNETEVEPPPAPKINIDLNTEKVVENKEKSSPPWSLRQRPLKKPKIVIQIDDSESETDSRSAQEAEPHVEVQEARKDSPGIKKRKRKKSSGNKLQQNFDSEKIPDDRNRSDLPVNILGAEKDSSGIINEETGVGNGELRSTATDICDNDSNDSAEVPRSPSQILNDHESTNAANVDQFHGTVESQPQMVDRSSINTKTEKKPRLNTEDVENEETSSVRRSLRRPQKKPTCIVEIDDNASKAASIYSPEAGPGFDGDGVHPKASSKIVKRKLRKSPRNKLPHTTSKQSQLIFPYNCKVCGHGYFSQYFLSLHEKNHIQGDLEYACTICEKSFNAHLKLAHHYSSFHKIRKGVSIDSSTGLKSFHCTYCDKVYKSENFKLEAGSDKLKIPCDQAGCEKIFSNFLIFSYHHDRTCLNKLKLIAEERSTNQEKKDLIRTYCSKPKTSSASVNDTSKIAKGTLAKQTSQKPILSNRGNGNVLLFPYRCDICGAHIMYLGSFLAHQKTHRRELDHSCTKCARKFSSLFRLKLHYLKGHKIKFSIPYSTHACRYCGKIYDVKFVDEKDSGKSGYLCAFKECKFIAPTPANYRSHHMHHHRRINRGKPELPVSFRCKCCNKLYTYKEVASSGEDSKVVFCCTFDENCKEICPSMQALSDHHMCVHHNKANSGVEICSSEKFLCKTCDKVFTSYRVCKYHVIRAHTKEFKYYCEICGKGCPSLGMYNAHIKSHSTERKFKCDQCQKTFKKRSLLSYHMNMHNGIKPYVCEFCGKAFHNCNSLKMHKHNAHKEEIKKN